MCIADWNIFVDTLKVDLFQNYFSYIMKIADEDPST